MRAIVLLLGMVLLGGCGSPRERITGCAALGELAPVCGFSRPEDMELLGDSRTLLISEMGSPQTNSPGSLVLFDTRSETITRLLNMGVAPFNVATSVNLISDASCPTCSGSGASLGTHPRQCGECSGRGVSDDNQGFFSFSRPCHSCQGRI